VNHAVCDRADRRGGQKAFERGPRIRIGGATLFRMSEGIANEF
jgi:hypothetical protein